MQDQTTLDLNFKLASIISSLSDLSKVDILIQKKFEAENSLISEIPKYLFSLGGKKLRPIIALLCGKALGFEKASDSLITISAGIELIHMATLLHDDIIDNSPLRRHKPSPLSIYGSSNTLLAGDFLLVRAFSLCSKLDPEIVEETEKACIALTEGEIMETSVPVIEHSIDSVISIAKKKTASLFKLATFSAAKICGLDSNNISLLSNFGENLGIAFQMLDDILDVVSDEETFGKKPGTDILEQKPSIVNILWLNKKTELANDFLVKKNISNKNNTGPVSNIESEDKLKEALLEIINLGVIDQAREYARKYALIALDNLEKCFQNLSDIKANNYKKSNFEVLNSGFESLKFLVEYTLKRVK